MLFENIIGQEKLKEQLLAGAKGNRISHAQFFWGEDGYGALPLAIAYCQFLSCKNKQASDSCGSCSSCNKFESLVHPDLHFVFPVNTNDVVKTKAKSDDYIQDWRSLIAKQNYFDLNQWHQEIGIDKKEGIIGVEESKAIIKKLNYKPYESEFKFLIIWHAERMNAECSNKLLKLLEEPSDKTVIILLSPDEESILKTIRSRVQKIRVPPIDFVSIEKNLKNLGDVDERAVTAVTKIAQGNWIKAKSQVSNALEELKYFELFKSWMRACYKADLKAMHTWVESISSKEMGRESQKRFISYAIRILREGLMVTYGNEELQMTYQEEHSFTKKFSPFVHARNVLPMTKILTDAHYHVGRNAYSKILFMDLSMKFANMLHIKNVHL